MILSVDDTKRDHEIRGNLRSENLNLVSQRNLKWHQRLDEKKWNDFEDVSI
jgi:hypothetical protein